MSSAHYAPSNPQTEISTTSMRPIGSVLDLLLSIKSHAHGYLAGCAAHGDRFQTAHWHYLSSAPLVRNLEVA